jgi:hypothetical protein
MSIKTVAIHDLDSVELLVDLPNAPLEYPEAGDAPLHVGDRGVVVFAHNDGQSFTVEFFRDGETVAITEVRSQQMRLVDEAANEASDRM